MASRSQSYKTSSTMDKREKRLMRVHRRSLDQREMRHEEVNKRRQIDDMSPVVELESHEGSKNPSRSTTPADQKAALSRLERLKKWKEERELKRKLEAMERARSKPGFKVVSMKHEDHQLFQRTTVTSNSKKAEKVLPPKPVVTSRQSKTKVAQPAVAPPATKSSTVSVKRTAEAFRPVKKTATATRMTRSRTAAVTANTRPVSVAAPKATEPKQPSPKSKRSGRSNYMAPTAASQTRAAVGAKSKKVKKESTRAPEKKTHQPPAEVKGASKISTHRGDLNPLAEPSFAPNDFVFEAPSSVTSFVFKPLSPASAASFLFPSVGGNSTTMSIFTKRVGRTSTPKRDGPPSSTSSEQKDSDEDRRASPLASPAARPHGADDGSRRRSRSRQSHTVSGVASPASTIESPASGGAKSGPASDSDMEVASREVSAGSSETPADENRCADDATHGMEVEVFEQTRSAADVHAPRRNRKRSSTGRQSRLEVEAVAEQDRQSDGESSSSPSCRQRKSKRMTRQKTGTVESQEEDTKVKSPVKRRRSSRRSTIARSESVAQPTTGAAAIEAIAEEASSSSQPSQPGSEKVERRTPRKARRSCRSSVAEDEAAVQEDAAPMEVVPETQEGTENQDEKKRRSRASRGERRSRRSQLPNTNTVEESVHMETEAMETAAEAVDNAEQAGALSAKKRRSRRSVAKQQEEAAKNDEIASGTLLSLEKPVGSAEKAGFVEVVQSEAVPPEATTPKSGKRSLRGKDGPFLTPGPPISSQRRSTAKRRRRTATMVALSTAKSPEEAIKIISTSPMIEMNRRTPKSKMSPELRLNTTAALFDDEDFLVEPVELSSVFNALSSDGTATDDVTSVDATSSSDTALIDGTTTDDATATDDALTETTSTGSADAQETTGSSGDEPAGEKRDVTPFREKLSTEVEKLTRLAEQWTAVRESTPSLSEEVDSQMSTTVCQVYLLMGRKGKFHQFAGLVDKCESGDPRTTCQDLQGFWDMIFIQAEDIYSKFAQLERLKQNNWQAEVSAVAAEPKAAKKVKKAAGGGSRKEKPVVKSKFAEFRAQMKQRKAEGSSSTSKDVPEEKVFDAGFFKVNSPIRSPKYHCPAGTPVRPKSSRESQESGSTPATSLDQAATPTMMTTPTTAASSTTSAKTAENKENVAQVMLRRSVGSAPGRKSYAPAVPSPLLKDAVPVPRSSSPPQSPSKRVDAAAAAQQSVGESGAEEEMKKSFPRRSAPRRRSTRSRKSVCFAEEPVASTTEADREEKGLDPCYFTSSGGQPASPLKESALDNSPFSCEDILKHGASRMPAATSPSADTPLQQPATGGRRKSALKVLPTRELRRSRRSVTFSLSPSQHSCGSLALPSTPYNRNSLVAGKRVDHHSLTTPGSSSHLALEELQDLQSTPQMRRSARPSLLYTPPQELGNKPKTPVKDIPVAKLISFSP